MARAGNVRLDIVADAQDRARAVLRQTNKSLKRTRRELGELTGAQTGLGRASARLTGRMGEFGKGVTHAADSVGKLAGKVTLAQAAVGALAGAALVQATRALADFAVEGEKAANVAISFDRSFGTKAASALKQAQKATLGLVEATDLQIVLNRYKRLGVSVDDSTRLLELATKASLDQGRSVLDVAKIIESTLKGRTTALTEIGVSIDKVTGLTEEYAKANGIAASEVNEQTRHEIALKAALRELGNQFDAVDTSKFVTGAQKANTAWGDAISDMQVATAKFLNGVDDGPKVIVRFEDAARSAGNSLDQTAHQADGLSAVMREQLAEATREAEQSMRAMRRTASETADTVETLIRRYATMTDRQGEAAQISAEINALVAQETASYQVEMSHLQRVLKKTIEDGMGGAEETIRQRMADLANEHLDRIASIQEEVKKRVQETQSALDEELQTAKLSADMAGKSMREQLIAQTRLAAATAERNGNLKQAITLYESLAQLARQEASQRDAKPHRRARRKSAVRSTSARSPEGIDPQVSLRLLQAQLEVDGKITAEEQRQLINARAQAAINDAALAYMRDEITLQREQAIAETARLDQRRDLLELERQIAEAQAGNMSNLSREMQAAAEAASSLQGQLTQIAPEMSGLTDFVQNSASIWGKYAETQDDVSSAVLSQVGASAQAASSFIKNEQAKYALLSVAQLAYAAASFATQNYAAGALHLLSAGLFGAAAGGAFGGGAQQQKRPAALDAKPDGPRSDQQQVDTGPRVVVVDLGSRNGGMILGRAQDVGREVGRAVGALTGTGYSASSEGRV